MENYTYSYSQELAKHVNHSSGLTKTVLGSSPSQLPPIQIYSHSSIIHYILFVRRIRIRYHPCSSISAIFRGYNFWYPCRYDSVLIVSVTYIADTHRYLKQDHKCNEFLEWKRIHFINCWIVIFSLYNSRYLATFWHLT